MKQVLIIEDEAFLRNNIVALLEIEGFTALGAESGKQGIKLARERLPHLIIADIMMPGLDGFEVLQELRNTSVTATIPFIFLTAKDAREDVRRGMELGADDYITKPFRTKELLAAVRAQFDKQAMLESARLRSLSHYLVEVQEAERSRLAHELHNDINQLLSGLKMTLGIGKRLPPQAVSTVLDEAQQMVDAILQRIKQLSHDLRPAILDTLGLLPALQQFLDQFTAPAHGPVHLIHSGLDRRFPAQVETVAYRIVQKMLVEIMEYALSHAITVHVWAEDEALSVEISDNNSGFDLNVALNVNPAAAFVELHERVTLLGGQLLIESSPDTHTRVYARLPLTEPAVPLLALPELPELPELTETAAPVSNSVVATPATREAPVQRENALRVVLADAHDLMRQGVRTLFETVPDIVVVRDLTQLTDVVNAVSTLKPDVVVLDPGSVRGSQLDLIATLNTRVPQTHILVLSMHTEAVFVAEMLRRGAIGYVSKATSADDLLLAVRQVAAGKQYLSPSLFADAVEAYLHPATQDDAKAPSQLTQREQEVLLLVVDGFKNAEIAQQLSISRRTVETHRANMMRKLNLRSQAALIRYALDHNLTTGD